VIIERNPRFVPLDDSAVTESPSSVPLAHFSWISLPILEANQPRSSHGTIRVGETSDGESLKMPMPPADPKPPQPELFDDQVTDVEPEDVDETGAEAKPWDPTKIRISTKPFSLRQVVDMVEDGDIDLAPDFQRRYVWKPLQRSRLIESVLLGIPLPAFYFSQDHGGSMQVVDGVQRLTTIHRFVTKAEPLHDLEYLTQLEGQTYETLDNIDKLMRRRFQQTQIFVNVIEPQTPDDVKFDVFRRINTGGSPLTAQEIRHCMSRSRSRDLLKDLVALPSFRKATDGAFENDRRMADREAALRFCAFRCLDSLDTYKIFPSLDSFLLNFTRRVDGSDDGTPALSDDRLSSLKTDFDRAMRSATVVFDKYAFRKYPIGVDRRGPINRALFESWAVAFADYEPEQVAQYKPVIMQAARQRMRDAEYNAAISQGTGDFRKVELRFRLARRLLKDAIKGDLQ
jgi:hypothetical protein